MDLPTDFLQDSSDDEELQPTQPVDDRVLKDVVVYVEVRSTNDNRSTAISKELQQLGARVCKKFTDDVTHVVFKEGSKRTKNKANKKGIHLVSVLWVDSCKRNQEHVSERMFPASIPDEKSTPLFMVSKLKKAKSMQPKDFDEDVASSAEKFIKRKQRIDIMGRLKSTDNTPVSSPSLKLGNILVQDTQPRTPLGDDILTPVRLAVPDTPPSMREKMEHLRRQNDSANADTDESQKSALDPLQKRLFDTGDLDRKCQADIFSFGTLSKGSPSKTPTASTDKSNKTRRKSMGVVRSTEKVERRTSRRKSFAPTPSASVTSNIEQKSPKISGKGSKRTHGELKGSQLDQEELKEDSNCDKLVKKKKSSQQSFLGVPNNPSEVKEAESAHSESLRENSDSKNSNDSKVSNRGRRKSTAPTAKNKAETQLTGSIHQEKKVRGRRKSVSFLDVSTTSEKVTTGKKQSNRRKSIAVVSNEDKNDDGGQDQNDNDCQSLPITRGKNEYTSKTLERIVQETEAMSERKAPAKEDQTNQKFSNIKSKEGAMRKKLYATHEAEPCMVLTEPKQISQKVRPVILDISATESKNLQNKIQNKKGKKRQLSSTSSTTETQHAAKSARKNSRSTLKDSVASNSVERNENITDTESVVENQEKMTTTVLSCQSFNSTSNMSVDQSTHGMSMSAVFGDNTMSSSGLCPPRPSIAEFNLKKFRPNFVKIKESSKRLNSKSYKTSYTTSSDEKSSSDNETRRRLKGDSSLVRHSPCRPSLVMTSLHTHEQDVVISIVKQLNGFVISENVSDTTTHIVCGGPRRTLNLLHGLSRGCWILHQNWVLESLEVGRWLPEEKYEVTDWFPAVKVSRENRETLKENFASDLFSTVGCIFVCHKTSPPRPQLISLIRLCGGQVTSSSLQAQVVVGSDFYTDKLSVSPGWILDCLTQQSIVPTDKYMLGRPKRESSPEF